MNKVIIIGPAYPLRGGIADTNESLCKSLTKLGLDAKIVTFSLQYPQFLFPGKSQYSDGPAPANLDIKVWINSISPLNWIVSVIKLNKLAPDLVIIRFWLPFMAPCLGTIARLLRKKTKVIGLCDNVIPHEKRIGDKLFTKYFVNGCDAFVTMSKTVQEELKEFTNKKSLLLHHPINYGLGKIIDKEEACKQLNLDPKQKYMLFFGLIRKYKGLDLLLKALANTELQKLGVKLIVAGEFYDDPQEYETLISDLKIKDSVIIHNKFIPNDDIQYYFSAVDLVTQTYHYASQSGITQIAYHFDRPMIVTNVGGLPEMVPNNIAGYVVEKKPNDIADAIIKFYKENRFNEFSNNVKTEKTKYSWETFSQNVLELSKEL